MSEKPMMDKIDEIRGDFRRTDSGVTYTKEKLTSLNKEGVNLEFKFLHVAISPNGGFIGLCKKKDYFDLKKSRINDNVIIMHQDGSKKYFIKIDWNYSQKYVVSLEFTESGKLYGFCNDGTIYKFDILTEKAIEKPNHNRLKEEGMVKVKLFDKGFIVLTGEGNIYLVNDLRDPVPVFIIGVNKQLHFSNNIEFMGIPPSKSGSGKFELLINNEKGDGVIHVIQQDSSNSGGAHFKPTYDIFLLSKEVLEKYDPRIHSMSTPSGNSEFVDLEDEFGTQRQQPSIIKKVMAMAYSPSKNDIALYCPNEKAVFLLGSHINKGIRNNIKKINFKVDTETDDPKDTREQQAILFFHEKYQFCFCGEEALIIGGQRFVMLVNKNNDSVSFKIIEGRETEAATGKVFFNCCTELDGLRVFTDEGITLITQVPKEVNELCDPFSDCGERKLVEAYGDSLQKSPFCNRIIREISANLPKYIFSLMKIAANLYWTERDPNTKEKKEVQNYLIKAAQFGKSFVQKDDFNHEKFNNLCKAVRILCNMRNGDQPVFLTYEEYQQLDPESPDGLVTRLTKALNFKLAFDISEYLGFDVENVYLAYAMARIKRLPYGASENDQESLFTQLDLRLSGCSNVPYIAIAKKCIKYKMDKLAELFLEKEKSILVKIPQYLQLRKWNEALELAIKSCDWNVLQVVLDKVYRVEEPEVFIDVVSKFDSPNMQSGVVTFFKKIGKEDELAKYLENKKNEGAEELLFICLEKFFTSNDMKKRREYLKDCKKHLKNAKNINKDFYEQYLNDLMNSIDFKKICFDKQIVEPSDLTPFDTSTYDFFEKGVLANYSWIDSQNKKFFKISKKKVSNLTIKALAKKGDVKEITEITKKNGFKNLEISAIEVANILFEHQLYMTAVEYVKQEDSKKFEEKIKLLEKMNKPLDMVEVCLMDKKNDKLNEIVKNALAKNKELRGEIKELCAKYKVNINLGI